MLNRTIIMGRLTRDPELRQTQNGLPVSTFSLAVERDFKDKSSGEKVTDYFDVVTWRQTAEFVCRYFSKGRMMVVDGRLQSRKWEDRNGNKRVSIEIVADSCYFGDSKKDGDGGSQQRGYQQGQYPPGGYQQPGYQQGYGGGYSSGYGSFPAGGSPSYPDSDYGGGQFEEIDDNESSLPF